MPSHVFINGNSSGLKFINDIAEAFQLPLDTRRVVIEAEVGGLLVVRVERLPKGQTYSAVVQECLKVKKAKVIETVGPEIPEGASWFRATRMPGDDPDTVREGDTEEGTITHVVQSGGKLSYGDLGRRRVGFNSPNAEAIGDHPAGSLTLVGLSGAFAAGEGWKVTEHYRPLDG